ncbi:late competence protein ComEC, DNA transport [Lentilactobacillus kosonis]|uniref:Late competence protein ComEC, DNA transport n=1 Tax=Lentilactobacillus kosonis TaxID=2810561 RepID=A0A401FP49_9LACO|nr:late competence protein ComEC, DNA transport [Lentilactobacillus kosonis]
MCLILKYSHPKKTIIKNTEQIRLYPDQIKVNGDKISFVTTNTINRQKSVYFGQLRSHDQKWMLQNYSRAINLSLSAKLSRFKNPTNVNEFDIKKYYHYQGINQLVQISELHMQPNDRSISVSDLPHILRTGLLLRTAGLPVELRRYCLALIIGFRDSDFYQAMIGSSKLGLMHVFSVSGMHVYYFLILLDKILLLIKLPNKLRIAIEVGSLIVYFQFAGGSPGLFRAVVMAVIGLLSQAFKFKVSNIDCWSLTLIMQLFVLPQAVYLLSVQLSYSLALGIIVTANWRMISKTVMLNAISFPIIIYNFYEWHLLSIAATVIFLPILTSVIFPMVVLICIVGNGIFITTTCEWFIKLFNELINQVGELPGMVVFGKPPLWLIILELVLTYYLAVNGIANSKRAIMIIVSLYLGAFSWLHFPLTGEVTMIDVGQGDSFLIRQPFNRHVTLIDTGGKVHFKEQVWQRETQNYQADRLGINFLKVLELVGLMKYVLVIKMQIIVATCRHILIKCKLIVLSSLGVWIKIRALLNG